MCSITFLTPQAQAGMESIQIRLPPSEHGMLIDLMEREGLADRCECRDGVCGKCAVKVAVLCTEGQRAEIHLGRDERETLYAQGMLTRRQYELPFMSYSGPIWRLACQYPVGEHDIVVAL